MFTTSKSQTVARVLVVEDHPDLGNLIRAALGRALIEATLVTSGEAALQTVRQAPFDLILLDIALPGMSGLDVCRALKADKALSSIPVIFVSGQTSSPYKAEAKRLGAADFIEKPFELVDFLARILGRLRLQANEAQPSDSLDEPLQATASSHPEG